MVPGPSRETILNTIGTCSTVHRMPYPRRCSATESWRGWVFVRLKKSMMEP